MNGKTIKLAKRLLTQLINPALTRPQSGRIIVTENCPLRCRMCTFWHTRSPEPSLEVIKYWIKEMADFGIKDIDIGGGEPFIRKDLTEIVNEVKSYGITCSVTTSGWLVGQVPFPPVDRCEISIDGVKAETHDKIRGVKGSWEKAINAVKIAQKHCWVSQLSFVLQKDNYHELVDFCRLAKKLGLPVSLIPVSLKLAAQSTLAKELVEFDLPLLKQLIDQAIEVGNLLNNRSFLKIFLTKMEKGSAPQTCLSPFNCILIFTNGDVYPCGNFDAPVGNLSQGKKLKDIYRDYRNWRKIIISGTHERCSRCIYPDIITPATLRSTFATSARRRLRRPKPRSS